MRDLTHLDWPFFTDLHRRFASGLAQWTGCEVARYIDHSDLDGSCRALVRALGEAGWLKAVVPLLQLRTQETDTGVVPGVCSGRVQFAFDRMYVAACERIARILRSDLGSDQD